MLLYVPHFEIAAFVFLLMLTIFFFIKENLYTQQSTVYGILLIVVLITLGLDIFTVYTISYTDLVPLWVNILLNTLLYTLYIAASVLFTLFTLALTKQLDYLRKRGLFALMLVPSLAATAMLIANFRTSRIFYFDRGLAYIHGPLFFILYICCGFYVLLSAYFILRYRKKVTSAQFYTILLYLVLIAFSFVLQYHYPKYLLSGAFIALALTSTYFTFQNPDTFVDGMTKLLGRPGFLVAAGQTLRSRGKTAIILIDINSFKTINDLFGILTGDELIKQVVGFLQHIAPNKRRVFRIGGNQFALIVRELKADMIIEEIRRRFKYSWTVAESRLHLSVSMAKISLSRYISTGEDLLGLIENTLLIAKEAGPGSYISMDDKILDAIKRRVKIENSLRNFENNNCLRLNFQPIFSVSKGRITSAEVLLRMHDRELGEVPPDEFIKIAERTGMINRMGRYVLSETCRYITESRLWNYGIEMIDLNLSPAECLQEDYAEYIKEVITSFPFEKKILNFEITETVAATSFARVAEIMDKLSAIGVSFALDDYSQGYSNSETLTKLNFKIIKFDKSLLWDAVKSEKANIVYRNMVKMVKELGMQIIAEGAETCEHVALLYELGVDFIQGYYYGRPLSMEEFVLALSRGQKSLQT